jgi:YidC/Oxa1 family membrane protein insertase
LEWVGYIWDLIILNPLVNVLIMLSHYLFGSFGLAIIVLTIIVNLAMYPLTLRQLRASKAMQEMQAEIAEVRKKYAKDKQKAASEQMRLMKESGVSPAGCLLPMLVQMPVWIALYQSVIRLLAIAPEGFLDLSQRLYTSWNAVFALLPLENQFLWLNLASADMFIAILVGVAMWVQQKMTTPPSTDPQQQAQGQMMQWMMPLMFGFICLSVPSGLGVYWFTSTVIRIALQYFTTGWGGLSSFSLRGIVRRSGTQEREEKLPRQKKQLTADDTGADIVVESESAREEGTEDGKSGSKREDSRRSYTGGYQSTRRQSGRSKSRRNKRR